MHLPSWKDFSPIHLAWTPVIFAVIFTGCSEVEVDLDENVAVADNAPIATGSATFVNKANFEDYPFCTILLEISTDPTSQISLRNLADGDSFFPMSDIGVAAFEASIPLRAGKNVLELWAGQGLSDQVVIERQPECDNLRVSLTPEFGRAEKLQISALKGTLKTGFHLDQEASSIIIQSPGKTAFNVDLEGSGQAFVSPSGDFCGQPPLYVIKFPRYSVLADSSTAPSFCNPTLREKTSLTEEAQELTHYQIDPTNRVAYFRNTENETLSRVSLRVPATERLASYLPNLFSHFAYSEKLNMRYTVSIRDLSISEINPSTGNIIPGTTQRRNLSDDIQGFSFNSPPLPKVQAVQESVGGISDDIKILVFFENGLVGVWELVGNTLAFVSKHDLCDEDCSVHVIDGELGSIDIILNGQSYRYSFLSDKFVAATTSPPEALQENSTISIADRDMLIHIEGNEILFSKNGATEARFPLEESCADCMAYEISSPHDERRFLVISANAAKYYIYDQAR